MKGTQITCLEQLAWGERNRRSVVAKKWFGGRPRPSAFVMSMKAWVVAVMIKEGLWFYVKPLR